MRKVIFLLWILVCSAAAFGQDATEGSLFAVGRDGKELGACPLKTTAVRADISGFLARVTVKQEFENKFTAPIEAVYVFPLSQKGAVDSMTMTVGERVIRGKIMRREEARQTYEAAKSEGKTASLLDQERPNIFTQSVANIMPDESVIVEISYVETLKYEDGAYEFVFPMTVGPRYIPGGVKDAARIKPPVARTRAGHDVSIEINLNAGVPVESIRSTSHAIDQINLSPNASKIALRSGKVIPNKDFILRYDVTGKRIEDAVLAHRDERGGFFTMILQPPDKIATEDRTPKEIVFVLDTSGSMEGFPIEKAKEAMRLSLDGLYPEDTFNLITFAGDTAILFDKPVPATEANLEKAQAFLAGRQGYGGTEMMKAIKAALEPSDASDHLRIVCFMTDGEVGNDDEIIAEVQKHPKARVFSFGIGSSVNRSLLDKIAQEGNGEAEYVALEDDGSKAAKKFYERVRTPLLTDVWIDWNGMPVADVYPNKLTDLFSAKPVIVHGRYTGAASGTIRLKGKVAGQPYERIISVNLPAAENENDVLATLWARTRIDDIASEQLKTADSAKSDEFDTQITNLGLEFGLLTSFTSFVAVADRVVNQNGKPVTIQVPVELPEGVNGDKTVSKSFDRWGDPNAAIASNSNGTGSGGGGGGGRSAAKSKVVSNGVLNASPAVAVGNGRGTGQGSGRGTGSGSGSGTGTGSGNGIASSNAATAPPALTQTVNVMGTTSESVDVTESKIQASVTVRNIQQLPNTGRAFTSLLSISPGVRNASNKGGLQVDGAGGSENTFVVDGTEVTNFRTDTLNANNRRAETDLGGRTVLVVRPNRPAGVKAFGEVAVHIQVDVFGNVVSARAVSGSQQVRKASEAAARLTRFAPTLADGKAVRLRGTIVYRFRSAKRVDVGLRSMKAMAPTEADNRLIRLGEKLHFWIAALVQRIHDGSSASGPNESKFVRDGKASIQVELTTRSPTVIERLKAAGFEIVREKGKTWIVGRIALEKLATLAEIEEVKLVLPQI